MSGKRAIAEIRLRHFVLESRALQWLTADVIQCFKHLFARGDSLLAGVHGRRLAARRVTFKPDV